MNRLLALDGGGIRGVFTIAVLERIESLLRERHAKEQPGFVLADYFNFIGGTSTGAIIAAMLSQGMSGGPFVRVTNDWAPSFFAGNPSGNRGARSTRPKPSPRC